MTDIIHLSDSNTVVVSCEKCKRQRIVDMTPYLNRSNVKKLKISCKCGNIWKADLEKRRDKRKPARLPGYYVVFRNEKWIDSGNMMVVNISPSGLGLKLNRETTLKIGDWLEVDFKLDDEPGTYIIKTVQIKSINSLYVGTSFEKNDHDDPDIIFYVED